jgi:uncharacterized membrane protein YhaH (DUF805 family)
MSALLEILRGEGRLDRSHFAASGLGLAALKQGLDIVLASLFFGGRWSLVNYWAPLGVAINLSALGGPQSRFLLSLVATALPFIWVGVALTLARLRDAGLPAWLALFFFVPFLNLLFFVFLCSVPGRSPDEPHLWAATERGPLLDRLIPRSGAGSAFAGAMLTLVLGGLVAAFATNVLKSYGWGLFVGVPFAMGFASVLIYTYHEPRTLISCIGVAVLSPTLLGLGFLAYALEGIICLLMAAPLALPLAAMGGTLAFCLQRIYRPGQAAPAALGALLFALPLGMAAERATAPPAPVFSVTSSVEVNAPPEKVWPNVIAFAELPPPQEFLFRAGIAYPIRAEIRGAGPGAVRHCVFSTGPFVEPIEIWDAPRLLKFSVESNPAPLDEWTPYERVTPPHLRGFLVSQGGQFMLTPLPGGRTRLEGTTWYRHSMWPASYWRLWSDHIIHQIHLRVLHYIAARSVSVPVVP